MWPNVDIKEQISDLVSDSMIMFSVDIAVKMPQLCCNWQDGIDMYCTSVCLMFWHLYFLFFLFILLALSLTLCTRHASDRDSFSWRLCDVLFVSSRHVVFMHLFIWLEWWFWHVLQRVWISRYINQRSRYNSLISRYKELGTKVLEVGTKILEIGAKILEVGTKILEGGTKILEVGTRS